MLLILKHLNNFKNKILKKKNIKTNKIIVIKMETTNTILYRNNLEGFIYGINLNSKNIKTNNAKLQIISNDKEYNKCLIDFNSLDMNKRLILLCKLISENIIDDNQFKMGRKEIANCLNTSEKRVRVLLDKAKRGQILTKNNNSNSYTVSIELLRVKLNKSNL